MEEEAQTNIICILQEKSGSCALCVEPGSSSA